MRQCERFLLYMTFQSRASRVGRLGTGRMNNLQYHLAACRMQRGSRIVNGLAGGVWVRREGQKLDIVRAELEMFLNCEACRSEFLVVEHTRKYRWSATEDNPGLSSTGVHGSGNRLRLPWHMQGDEGGAPLT
jgi:hypothetical protein